MINAKLKRSLMAFAIVASLFMTSCSKDDDSKVINGSNNVQTNPIVGTWRTQYTNIYTHDTYAVYYAFGDDFRGITYKVLVVLGTGVGDGPCSAEFNYTIQKLSAEYWKLTMVTKDGSDTTVYDDVYVCGKTLHMGGGVLDKM